MLKSCFVSILLLGTALPALAGDDFDAASIGGDTIVVTASRSGAGVAQNQLGASVTVLDTPQLNERQTRVVSDILRDVPGVAVNRSGGVGGLTQVRVRGTESNHVLVLIDGIEAADPFQGEYDFASLLADQQIRIEVLRGQQSSLYGSDAIGGVIHYITQSGADAPGYSVRAEGGSFGTFTGSARAAGVAGNLDYVVSGSLYHTNGSPTARGGSLNIGSDVAGISTKLAWSPTDNFTLSGVARYSHTKADSNSTEDDPGSPLFGHVVDRPGAHYIYEALYTLLRAQHIALDGRWTNAISGQVVDTTRRSNNATGFDYGSKGQRYKGSFESSLHLGNEALSHRLTAAVDLERERFRNLSPYDFVFQGLRETDNIGLVGQYELQVGQRLSFGASVRHDINNRFDDPTTWRAQVSYSLPQGTRLRGAYGTGVKNPGYFELFGYYDGNYIGNPNLRPEKSEGWEVGVEQTIGGDKAVIGLTWFNSQLRDEIYTTYPAPDFIATPDNRDTRSRQKGVELFLSAQPGPQIRFDLAYTYLDASDNGVTEVRRPQHVGSINTSWFSADERFQGTLTVRYNGRQDDVAYTDPSFMPVNVSLQEYVLVNVNAEYRITDSVTIYGRVENLFDEQYEEIFSYQTPGRGAYGGVRLSF